MACGIQMITILKQIATLQYCQKILLHLNHHLNLSMILSKGVHQHQVSLNMIQHQAILNIIQRHLILSNKVNKHIRNNNRQRKIHSRHILVLKKLMLDITMMVKGMQLTHNRHMNLT